MKRFLFPCSARTIVGKRVGDLVQSVISCEHDTDIAIQTCAQIRVAGAVSFVSQSENIS